MTWNELIARLNEIPMERREEPAVFMSIDSSPEEIDNVDYETETWDDLAECSIYPNEEIEYTGDKPIILTP